MSEMVKHPTRLAQLAGLPDVCFTQDDIDFLVSVCRAAAGVRKAQRAYYKARQSDAEKQSLLIDSKEKEKKLDELLMTPAPDGQEKLPV